MTATLSPAEIVVCPLERLIPGRGVAALLPDGRQIAVYLLDDGSVHALCNIDPIARAAVMSRGLVGDRAGVPVAISPIGKQAYALEDGRGIDDESHGLSVFPARVVDGTVLVSTEAAIRHQGRRIAA
ncbi:nitrite reductase small subunit NirD [Dietzia psychralcaliphila]|uniref:Nitrite reductase small subunit n=1 Tax=Dietzia psychralcaliphila TaxID=139021 RepID=A0AAD0JNU4_9ACTN|nr:nitrite reductase small subunit NirD [Dietzia psychralcaliphila]AWH94788.1 nitrite reductase small subunit [Dietzia psychralcaliphila]PTM86930.1 nitrite reductase (NADH) small subunit [Dietzia psychralcaliphila]